MRNPQSRLQSHIGEGVLMPPPQNTIIPYTYSLVLSVIYSLNLVCIKLES